MMLEHLGYPEAAKVVEEAIEVAIGENIKTFDLGGRATTSDVGKAVAEIVRTI